MKTRILIKKGTNELDGITTVSHDPDIEHVQPTETHDILDVPVDHPAIHESRNWAAPKRVILDAEWDRVLARKPQAQIDAEREARERRVRQ